MHLYKHRDFYLCAFLMTKEFKLLESERKNGYTEFYFKDSEALRKATDDYYSSEAKVNPMNYSLAIRNLKSLIHNNRSKDYQLSNPTEVLNHDFNNKIGDKK
ncbi:MAG: DUF5659 domain-containing protein [Melioribacteraceae bacterium]|nr:DUF5659 domain-containing protein [Melioribacteraceae bacterium]